MYAYYTYKNIYIFSIIRTPYLEKNINFAIFIYEKVTKPIKKKKMIIFSNKYILR